MEEEVSALEGGEGGFTFAWQPDSVPAIAAQPRKYCTVHLARCSYLSLGQEINHKQDMFDTQTGWILSRRTVLCSFDLF